MKVKEEIIENIPIQYETILDAPKEIGFKMASDLQTGSLLKTLAASEPAAKILEMGTGSVIATSWILEGMDQFSELAAVENDELLIAIAKQNLKDDRIAFVSEDACKWVIEYKGPVFDYIFAEAMPGNYDVLEETVALLKAGGIYIIYEVPSQPNCPERCPSKTDYFIKEVQSNKSMVLAKLNWYTGIINLEKIAASFL